MFILSHSLVSVKIKGGDPVSLFLKVLLVVIVIAVIALVALYFIGRKLEKKQVQQKELMDSMAQTVSMMIVDKKRMRISEASGLPKQVLEQTPKYLRRTKMPILRAKVGPKIMTLLCDEKIFDTIPLRTEVKAVVSGIYVTSVKSIRGKAVVQQPPKKKKFLDRFRLKA